MHKGSTENVSSYVHAYEGGSDEETTKDKKKKGIRGMFNGFK